MPNSILGKQGTFGGYQSWLNRARYRSPGDKVDFKTIFSKLSQYDFKGWAVMDGNAVSKSRRWCSRRC
jgi:sugar phosphate isomerase/epimerase